jgi:hypothetical protein
VSNLTYYLLWLGAGLAIIAVISAAITRHSRLRVMRRLKAQELLDALPHYSEWMAVQRGSAFLLADMQDASALSEMAATQEYWFPELSGEMACLFAVHNRVLQLLASQRRLRLQDPEAWLELDHEAGFTELWREQLGAMHALAEKLRPVAGAGEAARPTGTTSPA